MVRLEITLNDDGTLSMSGPIDNLFQCYGLLELAKDALRSRHGAVQQQVQRPSPLDVLALGRR